MYLAHFVEYFGCFMYFPEMWICMNLHSQVFVVLWKLSGIFYFDLVSYTISKLSFISLNVSSDFLSVPHLHIIHPHEKWELYFFLSYFYNIVSFSCIATLPRILNIESKRWKSVSLSSLFLLGTYIILVLLKTNIQFHLLQCSSISSIFVLIFLFSSFHKFS